MSDAGEFDHLMCDTVASLRASPHLTCNVHEIACPTCDTGVSPNQMCDVEVFSHPLFYVDIIISPHPCYVVEVSSHPMCDAGVSRCLIADKSHSLMCKLETSVCDSCSQTVERNICHYSRILLNGCRNL